MRCDRLRLLSRRIALRAALLQLNHVDKLPVLRPFPREFDLAVFFREQSVVAADANIHARMKMRAALTNDNVARDNCLTAEHLYAKSLAL